MAANKRSQGLGMLTSALDRNLNRNQEKPSTQAINEHAQWEFQSQTIKAASNQALPLSTFGPATRYTSPLAVHDATRRRPPINLVVGRHHHLVRSLLEVIKRN